MQTATQTNPNMTFTTSNGELVKQAYAKMGELDLSQAKASTKIGVGRAVFSQWLTDKYPGNIKKVEDKVQSWLKNTEVAKEFSSQLPNIPSYFETPSSRKITAALSFAQMTADLTVIYGGAGVSKTTTLRQYAKNNPNVWIVEATPCSASLGGFMRSLAQLLELRVISFGNQRMGEEIRKHLTDTNGLLIVDEAQFLNERALEMVRRIAEMADIGLALAGNESVYGQLTGNNRRSAQFAQLFSRIGKRVRLTRPTEDDIDALCDAWKLEGKQARNIIHQIAKKPGALRMATKTLRMATMIAAAQQQSLSSQHIAAAWKDLGGE